METTRQNNHIQLFDKCFKFLILRLSSKPLISFINGVFDEHHPLDSTVTHLNNEFITSGLDKRFTDSLITVASMPYLTEVQIRNDSSMVIRMIDYGFAYSRHFSTEIDGIRTMPFPREVVIYLESNSSTPDIEQARMLFPDGSEHLYKVPTLKLPTLSLEQLEEKGLFVLLPFEVLKLRQAVVAAKTSEQKQALAVELEQVIKNLMTFFEEQYHTGVLTAADWNELVVVIEKLNTELYKKEPEFKEVLNMFEDWDADPRIVAARQIDAAEERAREVEYRWQESEHRWQESEHRWQESERQRQEVEHRWQEAERQRQALELKLQEYERRELR
jgi:hypothetical protein